MDAGDQHVPTSPRMKPRPALSPPMSTTTGGQTEYLGPAMGQASMEQVPGQTVTQRRPMSHVSPTLSPLPPPALDEKGIVATTPGGPGGPSGPNGPHSDQPYPSSASSSSTRRVPADEKPYPDHGRISDPELGLVNEYEPCTLHRWAMEDVAPMALLPCLVTQALSAGVLDATTYADFSTFASNQTGNAIVLTLAAVGTIRALILLTGVSFAGFIAGAFIMGHLGNFFGPRRRIWLIFTTAWQCSLLIICAVFVSPHGPPGTRVGAKNDWAVLFLFAHMSGAQVVMARQSNCAEVPTAPMTSSLVDFVADQYVFRSWNNPKAQGRNRRLMYVTAMIAGSFIGAVLHRWTASWIVIMLAILLKALSGVLICFASPEN